MSLGLTIDASFPGLRVQLLNLETVNYEELWNFSTIDRHTTLSECLYLASSHLLKNKLSMDDIDAVYVGVGPGSFTGIKLALAFAYGFVETPISRRLSAGFSLFELFSKRYLEDFQTIWFFNSRQSAFVAKKNNEDVTIESINLSQSSMQLETYIEEALILDDSIEVPKFLSHCKIVSMSDLNILSRQIIREEFIKSWPNKFGAELCEPRYLKQTTPEERLQQK